MNFEFTEHNHLGSKIGTHLSLPGQFTFNVQVGTPQTQTLSPFEEARRAAKRIASQTKKPICVTLSGGVDSEAVALAFLAEKIPFYVAIMRFEDGLNLHDIKYAFEFCEKHSLKYKIFDLNLLNFYESGLHRDYAFKYHCCSPQITTHLWLIDQIEDFSIFSWNILSLKISEVAENAVEFVLPLYTHFCYFRILLEKKKEGIPFFFLYSPDLIYSFLRLPVMKEKIENPHLLKTVSAYQLKCEAYVQGGFEIKSREDKFTGFEEFKKVLASKYNGPENTFDYLYRFPYSRVIPMPRPICDGIKKEII